MNNTLNALFEAQNAVNAATQRLQRAFKAVKEHRVLYGRDAMLLSLETELDAAQRFYEKAAADLNDARAVHDVARRHRVRGRGQVIVGNVVGFGAVNPAVKR
jgi:hypothetical protein